MTNPDHYQLSHRRSYFAVLGSSFVSNTGNAFSNLAIPLYVLATTGSATRTGIVAFVHFAPPIVASIFGGALVDRIGRRRTLLIAESLNVVGTAAIPLLALLGILNFPILLVLVAVGAILDSPARAARGSMVTYYATEAGISPERAQSLNQSGYLMAQTIGPALAGITISLFGPATAIWIDAATFVCSFALVAKLVSSPILPGTGGPTTYLDDLKEGFRFVWHDAFLRSTILLITYLAVFFMPLYSVLYPVYFTEEIGSTRAFGLFVGLEAAGMFLGGLAYGHIAHRVSRWSVLIGAQLAGQPAFWLLILSPPIPVVLMAGLVSGFLIGPLNVVLQVALQVRTPERMRPRVYSLVSAGGLAAVPVGALVIGALIELVGVIWTFGMVATIYTIGPLIVALFPIFREIDHDVESANTRSMH